MLHWLSWRCLWGLEQGEWGGLLDLALESANGRRIWRLFSNRESGVTFAIYTHVPLIIIDTSGLQTR